MIWFYRRERASLSLETRYDNDTFEYVAVILHPDGRHETQRFEQVEAFRVWLQDLEKRLASDQWAMDGPAHILAEGWPDKPPMM